MDAIYSNRISAADTAAINAAYRQHISGTPIEELELDSYQKEVFKTLQKGVSSGKSGTQISSDTGYSATFCCDFKKIHKNYSKHSKRIKGYALNSNSERIMLRDYGITTKNYPRLPLVEVYAMHLRGASAAQIVAKCGTAAGLTRVTRFEALVAEGASREVIQHALALSPRTYETLLKLKREKEKQRV